MSCVREVGQAEGVYRFHHPSHTHSLTHPLTHLLTHSIPPLTHPPLTHSYVSVPVVLSDPECFEYLKRDAAAVISYYRYLTLMLVSKNSTTALRGLTDEARLLARHKIQHYIDERNAMRHLYERFAGAFASSMQ